MVLKHAKEVLQIEAEGILGVVELNVAWLDGSGQKGWT